MWKYDALNTDQERDYVNEKMRMIDQTMPSPEVFKWYVYSLTITQHTENIDVIHAMEPLNMNHTLTYPPNPISLWYQIFSIPDTLHIRLDTHHTSTSQGILEVPK